MLERRPLESWPLEAIKPASGGGGAANFVGTVAITFGQSGAFGAGAMLAGTNGFTFGETGDFVAGAGGGAAVLVGTTGMTFGQSGALLNASALAGTAAITFGQSGDFVAGGSAGAANFAGQAAMAFGQSGALALSAVMGGTIGFVFFATAALTPPINADAGGDGFAFGKRHQGVRPLPRIRPKAERALDEAMLLVEEVAPEAKVRDNKAKIKQALAIVAATAVPDDFAAPKAAIERKLKVFARNAAKHEGLIEQVGQAAGAIDNLVAAMEAKRKRRMREEEAVAEWHANLVSKMLMQPE